MTKKVLILLAVAITALSVSACTPENNALNLPPGKYQKDVKSTDANGVTTERANSTTVDVDKNGHKKAVVESKTTEKPPGFFNGLFHKTTIDQSTEVIEEK